MLSCIALNVLTVPGFVHAEDIVENNKVQMGTENGHTENGHTENGNTENGHTENDHTEGNISPVSIQVAQPAYNEADLFRKIFGKKTVASAKPRRITLPVMIDNQHVGTVTALLAMDGSGEAQFDWLSLKASLEDVILSEHWEPLARRVDQLGYLSTKDFTDLGWAVRFDQTKVAAKIEADTAFRKTQESSLRSRRPTPYGQRIEPATVSAIVNVSAAQDFRTGLASHNGRQPMAINFSGAANVKSLVLEGGANYQESQSRRWVRNDMRLVKDWQSKAVRFSVGDLHYTTGSLQAAPAIGGFSATRNFNLRPYDIVQSSGTANFVLETESRVEFYVNGQFVQSRDLPAGPHRLNDFPVSTGANDIMLRIKDKFGRVKEINIPFFYSNVLLNEGIHDFSYNVGYLTRNKLGVHHYDTKVPVYSLTHRYGLTAESTVGIDAQGSKKQTQVGTEVMLATGLGNIQMRGAASQVRELNEVVDNTLLLAPARRGYATTIQYDLLGAKDEQSRSLTVQWAHYTPYFSSLGQLTPKNPLSHRFTGRYSQEIFDGIYSALSGSYGMRHVGGGRENSQTLAFSKSFDQGLTGTLDLTRSRQPNVKMDERLMVGVRWSIPNTSHTLAADYQSQHHAKRVRWNYGSTSGVGSFASSAAVYHEEKSKGGDASLSYTANRAQGTVLYERNDPNNGPAGDRTSLIMSTALVFADGHMAISRPVSDSFVIVAPHASLASEKVCVNPSSDRCVAQNDLLGSAVVPDILAYNINTVSIDGSQIAAGHEIGGDTYYVEPSYKRGSVVKVGTDATVMVKGQLLGLTGQPVSLASAQIKSVNEPEREPVLFFTNRNGYFAAEGLKPGEYQIIVYGDVMYEFVLTIPEGTAGIYDIKAQKVKQADELMKLMQEDNL